MASGWITLDDGPPLDWIGGVTGVTIDDVGGGNGGGPAGLHYDGSGNLSWRGPRRSTWGEAVDVSAGGTFTLAGDTPDRWARVTVEAGELPAGAETAAVILVERTGGLAGDDVTAVEAAVGDVSTWTVDFYNYHSAAVSLDVWIEPYSSKWIEICDDGSSWAAPITAAAAFTLTLAAGGTDTLHIRRTIAAGADRSPGIPVRLLYLADDGADTESGQVAAWFRVFGSATLRAYQGTAAAPPDPTADAAFDTFAALPHETTSGLADGAHVLTLTADNGVYVSPAGRPVALVVAGGEVGGPIPAPPRSLTLENVGAGVIRVRAAYTAGRDGTDPATSWVAVYDDNDGFASPSGEQTATVVDRGGLAILALDLPAQSHGATCYVKLWMRRGSGGSAVDGPAIYAGPITVAETSSLGLRAINDAPTGINA